MDKSIKITCPNCSTEFLHLNSLAKQKIIDTVRCGACYSVFKIPSSTPKNATIVQKTQNPIKIEKKISLKTDKKSKREITEKNDKIKKNDKIGKPDKSKKETNFSVSTNAKKSLKNNTSQYSTKYKNTQPAVLRLKQFSSRSKKKTPYSLMLICILLLTASGYGAYQFLIRNNQNVLNFIQKHNCLTGNCAKKTSKNYIKSLNVNIEKIENKPHVLWVRAIIINTADTPKPYPNIQLSFSDISGKTVKKLIINPDDYLNTQLILPDQEPLMTPHQEVQLGFSIPDPKIAPLNYSLSLSY